MRNRDYHVKSLLKSSTISNVHINYTHDIAEIIQFTIIVTIKKFIAIKNFKHLLRLYYYLRVIIKLSFQTIIKLIY